jgi:hypothetical protein
MPSKKPTRAAKPAQPSPKPMRLTGAIGPKATFIVAGLVMAGGILVAARQQAQPALATTPRLESVPMPDAPVKTMALSSERSAGAVPASTPAVAGKSDVVTIAGCLERDGDGFRLKDVTGADAPKARSWKSGFLKKGKATIDVVDPTHALRLTDQVGKRVSVTGALADRELNARSLRRIAASCSK